MGQPISKQLAGLIGRLILACAFLSVMTNMVYPALIIKVPSQCCAYLAASRTL